MRTVPFQSVYNDILTRHGLDPLGDAVTHDTARAITSHMNDRIITVWQMWDWPDLMLTEERAYRSPWNSLIPYRRIGANGMPDEVYNIPDGNYYQVNAFAPSDPPLGANPAVELGFWNVFTPTTYVERDQPGMRPMGQVFGVYRSDPSLSQNGNGCCSSEICLGFRPSELGVTICNGPATTVFIQYLMSVPQYTFVPFIAGKAYAIGDRAFNTADGNVYRCIASTNTNTIGNPMFWVEEIVPAKFAHYLDEGTYADTLIETFASGEDQVRLARAQLSSDRADASVAGMIDDLLEQGQKHHWLRRRWWGFSWHYDGTIQWPASGNWCQTEPWSGNIVYPLTGSIYAPPLPAPPLVLAANTGTAPLVSGQSYVDVVFDVAQPNANWVFTELRVLNTVDLIPLNIWPGIVTSKSMAGFRLQLNGTADSANYVLQWTVNTISTAPVPATTYGLSGPATGAPGIPATFTVHLPSTTTVPGILVVTPHDGGAGGSFSPTSVGLTTASPSATFTYTAPSAGAKTIACTNNGGLIDPAAVTFTAAYATTYTLAGPSSGTAGTPSTPFTVALVPGTSVPTPVTVTPNDSSGGGTFTPTSVSITTGAPSATFTYTPASGGAKTISATNNLGLTDPGSLTYTVADTSPHLLNTLISYWKLDEATSATRNDSKGTNNLADTGGVVGTAGKINNCASFNGGVDYLSIANNSTLQVTSDFTFSVWVSLIDTVTRYIFYKGDSGVAPDHGLLQIAGTGLAFHVSNPAVLCSVGSNPSTSTWYHLVCWYDSADGKLRMRVNDTTTYVSSGTGVLAQTVTPFLVGASNPPANFFNGGIDEIGFWKRKLTTYEITALYNAGAGLPFSSFTT